MEGVKLVASYGIGGYTGWQDSSSNLFSVRAKTSCCATIEQNRKLEEDLKNAYKSYLNDIAMKNGGKY